MVVEKQTSPQVSYATIDENHHDQRIDNFLITYLKGVPKSWVYRVIRKGEVRVNKKRVKPEYRLSINDLVRIPPVKTSVKKPLQANEGLASFLKSAVLYEDENLMIINKPAGLPVHAGTQATFGVIEAVRSVSQDKNAQFFQLVHRLDKETSGCLMIAKNRVTLTALQNLFRDRSVKKIYLALTEGIWQPKECSVRLALTKGVEVAGERKVKVAEDGKVAVTHFKPLETFGRLCTLTEVLIETGRMHQIRVHAISQGHAIAGDQKYGDRAFNQILKKIGLRRLFLHAAHLEFDLPSTGEKIKVKAPLDEVLSGFLQKLAKKA